RKARSFRQTARGPESPPVLELGKQPLFMLTTVLTLSSFAAVQSASMPPQECPAAATFDRSSRLKYPGPPFPGGENAQSIAFASRSSCAVPPGLECESGAP